MNVQRFLRQFNWTALFLLALIILAPWGAPLVAAVKLYDGKSEKNHKNRQPTLGDEFKRICEGDNEFSSLNKPNMQITIKDKKMVPTSCTKRRRTDTDPTLCEPQKIELGNFSISDENAIKVGAVRQSRDTYQFKIGELLIKKEKEFEELLNPELHEQLNEAFIQLESVLTSLHITREAKKIGGGYCYENAHKALTESWELANTYGKPIYTYLVEMHLSVKNMGSHVMMLPLCVDRNSRLCLPIDTRNATEIREYLGSISMQNSTLCDKWNKFYGTIDQDVGNWLKSDAITMLRVRFYSPFFLNKFLVGLPAPIIDFFCAELQKAGFQLRLYSNCANFFSHQQNNTKTENQQEVIHQQQKNIP
jgi:hypothetical protein